GPFLAGIDGLVVVKIAGIASAPCSNVRGQRHLATTMQGRVERFPRPVEKEENFAGLAPRRHFRGQDLRSVRGPERDQVALAQALCRLDECPPAIVAGALMQCRLDARLAVAAPADAVQAGRN